MRTHNGIFPTGILKELIPKKTLVHVLKNIPTLSQPYIAWHSVLAHCSHGSHSASSPSGTAHAPFPACGPCMNPCGSITSHLSKPPAGSQVGGSDNQGINKANGSGNECEDDASIPCELDANTLSTRMHLWQKSCQGKGKWFPN